MTEVKKTELVGQLERRLSEDRRRDYVEMQNLIDERARLRKRRDLTATDRRLLNRILEERLLGLADDAVAERKDLGRRSAYPDIAPPPAP